MKYLLNTLFFLFAAITGFGQTMQASIGAGSSPSRVIVYIKPTSAVNGFISTFQFDVAILASISPVPTVSIVGTPAFGINWYLEPPFVEDGYRHYEFISQSNPSITIASGVETQAIELEFFGGPITANNVYLLTLGNYGGITGNSLFYFTGSATSVEGQLYYARSGTTVLNNNSYSLAANSYATISGVLPIKWLSFNAIKQGNDGLLSWAVASDDATKQYELQRSFNGTDFSPVSTINRSGNGSYNYTDPGITNLGVSILYYRIKQVDIDGKISYSDTRNLRLDVKDNQISIYPNPVKDGFYVGIPFANPDKRIVTLKLIAADGSVVRSKAITTAQAANYYFSIADMTLAAGNYNLQIIFEDKLMDNKKLFINK